MPAATAISTVPEIPPPFEVSAETMKAVMMLIAGSAVSIRTRREIAQWPAEARGDDLVDVDEDGAHARLDQEVVEDPRVAERDQRAGDQREEVEPGQVRIAVAAMQPGRTTTSVGIFMSC